MRGKYANTQEPAKPVRIVASGHFTDIYMPTIGLQHQICLIKVRSIFLTYKCVMVNTLEFKCQRHLSFIEMR